jgi:ATP-dependent exoDNAse (exonuclease V) beta subunit
MADDAPNRDATRLDELARMQALDPARSIVLQAPAGSGKTTVLTQRFLRLLCTVDEPEQVLAITFTRKAAAEMRERIVRALRGENDAATTHGTALGGFAAAAAARSRSRGWSIEETPARLRIQTIDSLSRWLAEQRPLAARGAGEASVVERPLTLYRMAARRTLMDADSDEELRPHAELLFERLDDDFVRFERLLTEMLQHRAHWLPRLLRGANEGNEGADLCARVTESLEAIVGERLHNARSVLRGDLLAEGAAIAREVAARPAAGEARGHWSVWKESAAGELTLAQWQSLAKLALTEQGNFRLSLTRREGFDEPALRSRALIWLLCVARVPGARELLAELAMLPPPALANEDAAALFALARLLRLAAAELEVVFQETSRVDFAHVSAAARQALTEGGAPTDLALRLGSDIRHILVDEFQDTSIEQFALLESLTATWEPGDGRTLFVVGDPMQSIYQFREAEVGLFLRTQQRGLGALALTPLALTRNFRSAPLLIDWANDVFARCFPELDNPRTSAVHYTASISGRGGVERAAVRVHAMPPGDPEAEAAAIAERVATLRAAEPGCSIAVLLSSRSHAPPIVQALERAGVRVTGVDLVALGELPVVRDLAALTRALDHLGDRTAWLAVLRAPWCGLTLTELGALTETAPLTTVWDLINDQARVASLPDAARARLLRAREALGRSLVERERCELARWVENAWLRLGGPAACVDEEDLGHARAFIEGLARWSAEPGWGGPLSLEESLAELYANHDAAPEDAVQIMTIHRAKGLEFDKVILPGLGRKLRANPEPLLRWLELPRDPDGSDLLMAAIPPP